MYVCVRGRKREKGRERGSSNITHNNASVIVNVIASVYVLLYNTGACVFVCERKRYARARVVL